MKDMRGFLKYVTGVLIAVLFAVGLNSCVDDVICSPEYPRDFDRMILIKNNLEKSVVVVNIEISHKK